LLDLLEKGKANLETPGLAREERRCEFLGDLNDRFDLECYVHFPGPVFLVCCVAAGPVYPGKLSRP
jgi:hypothetical protein